MKIPVPCAAITLLLAIAPVKDGALGEKNAVPEPMIVPLLVMPPPDALPPENREKPVMDAGLSHQPAAVDDAPGKVGTDWRKIACPLPRSCQCW